MVKPRVYAAGPITGQSFSTASGWYPALSAGLPECEIVIPMRGKDWAAREQVQEFKSGDYGQDFRLTPLENAISSDNGIFQRDLWDVRRADLVFANFLEGDEIRKVSIGTIAEVIAAKIFGNLSVVVCDPAGVHNHPFIRQAAWVMVDNFQDGLTAARIALNLRPLTDIAQRESPLRVRDRYRPSTQV